MKPVTIAAAVSSIYLISGAAGAPLRGADAPESFQTQMDAVMMTMHRDMHVPYSGDPDRDFAAMMVPHHQGAVDMALLELRYGHDPRLRRLAQGIIVEQRQEIAVMLSFLAEQRPRQR
jgi:uncharacterized protein (DUF305 family)